MPLDPVVLRPFQDRQTGQLGAVAHDHQRLTANGNVSVELARDTSAGERRVRRQYQAFAREVVDHREDTDTPAADLHVADEIQAPALVRPLWQRHGRPCPHRPLAVAPSPDTEVLLAIQSQQLLVVHDQTLTGQHDPQTPITEATPFGRDLA